MDFRTQIEENKRDVEAEDRNYFRMRKSLFQFFAEETAKDIRKRLLDVAKNIEKGKALSYCGYLHVEYEGTFYNCTEIDASTLFKSEKCLTYRLNDDFDIYFTTLSMLLISDKITLDKPFLIKKEIWWDYENSVAFTNQHVDDNNNYLITYIIDNYTDAKNKFPYPCYKEINIEEMYNLPYSCNYSKEEEKPHVELIIPVRYKF